MVWTPVKIILCRFSVVYCILYIILFSIAFHFNQEESTQVLIEWVANNIFLADLPQYTESSASFFWDFNVYLLLTLLLTSFLIVLCWFLIDRKKSDPHLLLQRFVFIVRYYLAFEMTIYGLIKIFGIQFSELSTFDLHAPLGEGAPMSLVWQMMGYSYGYSSFTGWLEIAAAVLLLFGRTQTLGALLNLTIMSNVVALNYFYDISVKMHSTHLLLMTIFLVSMDARRLWDFLVMNRPVVSKSTPEFEKSPNRKKLKILLLAGLASVIFFHMKFLMTRVAEYEKERKSELIGVYRVRHLQDDWRTRKELKISDWKEITIFDSEHLLIKSYDDKIEERFFEIDLTKKVVQFKDTIHHSVINFDIVSHNTIGTNVNGVYEGDTLRIKLLKIHADEFKLMK